MKKSPKEGAKNPSSKQQQIIVLVDNAKNYYEVSREALERSRVSEERKKEVEEALKDVTSEFVWIRQTIVPGSTAAGPLEGGRALHYAGYYLKSTQPKG